MTATNPAGPTGEFDGEIDVNNKPPTKRDLDKVADLPVLDVDGKPHTFKSICLNVFKITKIIIWSRL